MDMPVFAAFAVAPRPGGNIAATTRDDGRIGLPGGKVDPCDHSPMDTAIREAKEEGWDLYGSSSLIHDALVDGKRVQWFSFDAATPRKEFKEKGRITPISVSREEIAGSGFGNEFLAKVRI